MGFKDLFKTKKPDLDPLKELTLGKMKKGYFVDWDMKTWEVLAVNVFDFSEGDICREWQLESSEEIVYLELESDDEDFWRLSRKIPLGKLGEGIKEHIQQNDDQPNEREYEGDNYYLDEMAGGKFLKDEKEPGREFLRWSYADESGKKFLEIEQWGEEDFEASIGEKVEEYQFENILPRL